MLDNVNSVVNTPSSDLPSMDLVEPGDPSNSYLYLKLTSSYIEVGGAGSDMPPSGPLSSANLEVISTWITEGAPE